MLNKRATTAAASANAAMAVYEPRNCQTADSNSSAIQMAADAANQAVTGLPRRMLAPHPAMMTATASVARRSQIKRPSTRLMLTNDMALILSVRLGWLLRFCGLSCRLSRRAGARHRGGHSRTGAAPLLLRQDEEKREHREDGRREGDRARSKRAVDDGPADQSAERIRDIEGRDVRGRGKLRRGLAVFHDS